MKTLKSLLSVFAIIAVVSASAFAQTSITTSAQVTASASVAAGNDLDFGTLTDGDDPTVAVSTANVANTGSFNLTSLANSADFLMELSATDLTSTGAVTVALGGGAVQDIEVDALEATYTETVNDPETGTNVQDFTGGTSTATLSGSTSASASTNNAWVYVGGSLETIDETVHMGLYTGTITLTVYYQ